MITILLVGTEPLSLAGLRALLEREPGMKVIGQDVRPTDPISSSPNVSSDVTLIDHSKDDALEPLVATARPLGRQTPFMVLTSSTETALLSDAFRLGARGLVFKHDSPATLTEAIETVHAGNIWLDRAATTRLVTTLTQTVADVPRQKRSVLTRQVHSALTRRDHSIIELVSQGLGNRQVARELRVSEATIRNQLTSIFRKLGVTNRLQLVVHASQKGLVQLLRRGTRPGTKDSLRLV